MNVEAPPHRARRRRRAAPAHRAQPQRPGRDRPAALRAAVRARAARRRSTERGCALCRRAREPADTLCPGYTHLQRAQPVLAGHHFLAYVEMLARDRGRLLDAARRADVSPLGSGALAAPACRSIAQRRRAELGFDGVDAQQPGRRVATATSPSSSSSRARSATCTCRAWARSWCCGRRTEFRFVRLAEGYCSGSSLMPQKGTPTSPSCAREAGARRSATWWRC